MTLAARCHRAPPHCGERPSRNDNAVIQGQVSDHPSKATNTKLNCDSSQALLSPKWHEICETRCGVADWAGTSERSVRPALPLLFEAVEEVEPWWSEFCNSPQTNSPRRSVQLCHIWNIACCSDFPCPLGSFWLPFPPLSPFEKELLAVIFPLDFERPFFLLWSLLDLELTKIEPRIW